jgi:hypothetical protein
VRPLGFHAKSDSRELPFVKDQAEEDCSGGSLILSTLPCLGLVSCSEDFSISLEWKRLLGSNKRTVIRLFCGDNSSFTAEAFREISDASSLAHPSK